MITSNPIILLFVTQVLMLFAHKCCPRIWRRFLLWQQLNGHRLSLWCFYRCQQRSFPRIHYTMCSTRLWPMLFAASSGPGVCPFANGLSFGTACSSSSAFSAPASSSRSPGRGHSGAPATFQASGETYQSGSLKLCLQVVFAWLSDNTFWCVIILYIGVFAAVHTGHDSYMRLICISKPFQRRCTC